MININQFYKRNIPGKTSNDDESDWYMQVIWRKRREYGYWYYARGFKVLVKLMKLMDT
jgi:hypothetical protein